MKVIEVVELDEKGVAVNNDSKIVNYFDDNGDFPDGNYPTEDGKPINIAGEWLLINENLSNHLDGHKDSGYLGFKLNDDYFVTYRDEQFQMISL